MPLQSAMHIRWDDLGRPKVAGTYPCRAFFVLVEMQHIAVWRAYPLAVFDAEWVRPSVSGRVMRLTNWRVPPTEVPFT